MTSLEAPLTVLDDVIGRVRLPSRGNGARDLALTERRLATIEVRPRSLPPAAVLVVRRLAPALRAVSAGTPPRDRAWQAALDSAVDAAARRAVRPADAGPDSDAVVFADGAELLAWLARDLAHGALATRWWWDAIAPRARSLGDVLVDNAALVPAALARLETGEVAMIVSALEPGRALAVLRAVARAHGVNADFPTRPPAIDGVAPPGLPPVSPPLPSHDVSAPPAPGREAVLPSSPSPLAPWGRWWPASAPLARRAPAVEALLGLALALHHAPTLARSRSFALATRAWWLSRTRAAEAAVAAATAPWPRATPSPARVVAPPPRRPRRGPSTPRAPWPPAARALTRPPRARRLPRRAARAAWRTGADAPAAMDAPNAPSALEADGLAIDTRLAGAFYLLNAMRALGLPEAFEDDWHLGSVVGAWGVLEGLTRVLLERTTSDLAADPLWAALAALAGRNPRAPLGRGLHAAPYHAPREWRDEAGGPIGWAASSARLRLWREGEGDVLADVPRRGRLGDQLAAEVRATTGVDARGTLRRRRFRRAPPEGPRGVHLRGVSEPLLAWLALVRPFVARRLREALGAGASLEAALLRRDGRVWITASNVDVIMSLGSVSLGVRRAGLDADPRWWPPLGRVVALHYE